MPPRAVLIGPPGAGKSTIARALARLWDVDRWDTDAQVEAAAGKPISDIFIDDGEPAFRALEQAAVAQSLGAQTGVVSLGGGAVLAQATQELLASYAQSGGTVVFLDVSLAAAAPRVGLNTSRPLLVGNPRRQWLELMDARRPIYEGLATLTIDTSRLSPQQVAQSIVAMTA